MTLPALPDYLWFHVVTFGRVLLEARESEPTWLQPGELALVPHGDGHVLRSEPGVATPDVVDLELEHPSERYEILRHGGGGAPTLLICGAVRFDHPAARNLVRILPDLIHIDSTSSPQMEWMQSALRPWAPRPGSFVRAAKR